MKVVRVLIYEGDPRFIETSLAHRTVVGRRRVSRGCEISEYYSSRYPLPPNEPDDETLELLGIADEEADKA